MATAKTNAPEPVAQVEAASEDVVPAPDPGKVKERTVTTTVWAEGKTANRELLFSQAVANVRDAIPVASYDVACEVKGTKAAERDKTSGTAWEVEVTFTPRGNVDKPEPVDLDRIIEESKSGYGSTHPGAPDFLGQDN